MRLIAIVWATVRRRARTAACVGGCLAAPGPHLLAQTAPHPDPTELCWPANKVGAWATLASDVDFSITGTPAKQHKEMTNTVESVTPDAVTVRTVTTATVTVPSNGAVSKMQPVSTTLRTERHGDRPPLDWAGEESIQAAGRLFKTQVYTMREIGIRYYFSTEVPGCMVKMQMPPIGNKSPEVFVLSAFGW